MYLSQILLDPRSRQVQRRHRTAYQTHRSILKALPDPLPPQERVLFRREDVRPNELSPAMLRLLVQTQLEPDWRDFAADHEHGLLEAPKVRLYQPTFYAGQLLVFRLLANPTIKRDGRRLGLLREAEQIEWLLRKEEAGGFAVDLDSLRVTGRGFLRDNTGKGQSVSLLAVQFDGVLSVTDEAMFGQTIQNGIGSGKGLGCGLLSVARAG